jgi:opacity protein-like surface antigen
MKKSSLLTLIVLGAGAALARAETASDSKPTWSFVLSPYLWVAGVQVDTRLQDTPSEAPPETSRFKSKITGGALLDARVQYKSFGLLVDAVWLRLNTESQSPTPFYSAMNLESNFFHATAAFTYTVPTSPDFHLELLAGGRLWIVKEDITAEPGRLKGFASSGDATWVSPAVGLNMRYDLNETWSLVGRGLVNVLDGDSDGWEVMGGVTYRFSQAWSGTLGYRFLREEFTQSRLNFVTDISGFVVGFSYRF